MKLFTVVMCHNDSAAQAALLRHIPFYRQNGGTLLFYSPADKPVHVSNHENLIYGKACHSGPELIKRFTYLMRHVLGRAAGYERIVLHEYDSLCVSPCFPEIDDERIFANAFVNRDDDPRFREKMYLHPPCAMSVPVLSKIVAAMKDVRPEEGGFFWDRFLGRCCDVAGIEVVSFREHMGLGFSSNTIQDENIPELVQSVRKSSRVFHGVKSEHVLRVIVENSPWMLHAQKPKNSVKYISFCLYGDAPKYWEGMLRNIELAPKFYPGWTVRVYVPPELLQMTRFSRLMDSGADVRIIPDGVPLMMSRFLVHDDPSCDLFIVRDADSRFGEREVAAVNAWIASGRLLHVMHDHPEQRPFPGGMWGGVGGRLVPNMQQAIMRFTQTTAKSYSGHDPDQYFLEKVIFPSTQSILKHDAFPRGVKGTVPFPTKRDQNGVPTHVGAVFDENDVQRAYDWEMIKGLD